MAPKLGLFGRKLSLEEVELDLGVVAEMLAEEVAGAGINVDAGAPDGLQTGGKLPGLLVRRGEDSEKLPFWTEANMEGV